jgi:hypothetical protein
VLEDAINYLPPWASRHLERIVERSDRVYLDRYWPEPDVVLPLGVPTWR